MPWTSDERELVENIKRSVAAIQSRCVHCTESVDAHEVTLGGIPGNGGRPGIVTRIVVVEGDVLALQAKFRNVSTWMFGVLATLVAAGIIAVMFR